MEINSFGELEDFIEMFREKEVDFMALKGNPGTGKSHMVKEIIDVGEPGERMGEEEALYINTHLTPLQAYKLLFEYRDDPIIIDDIETLVKNLKLRSLFKQVGETQKRKWLQWQSTTTKLDNTPRNFSTTSNLLIISNEFSSNVVNKRALLDRGFLLEFKPVKSELVEKMREMVESSNIKGGKDVLDFLLEFFDVSDKINLRTLYKGLKLKKWGKDWKSRILRMLNVKKEKAIIPELEERYETVKEACEEWQRITGRCEKTYYNYKKNLGI